MLFIEALSNTMIVLIVVVVMFRLFTATLNTIVSRTHARIAREASRNLDDELRRLNS